MIYYQNQNVTLYKGDCLQILPQLDIKVDCVITDLHYGTTKNKWDCVIPFQPMWKQLQRLTKDNGVKIFTASQPFTTYLINSNIKQFRHQWIWQKNRGSNFANTVREPFKQHQEIIVFCKNGGWTYNKQMQERVESGKKRANYKVDFITYSDNYRKFNDRKDNVLNDLRVPSSIQKFNTQVGLHPTQKPVSLIEYLIKTYSNENDLILVFSSGSGTTDIACMYSNRRCILIQKQQKYCQISVKRLKEIQKEKQESLF